ncbi:MAG: N-acetyltransferase family protein [Planctomycetota bacterium]
MTLKIRVANPSDADEIIRIYAPSIIDCATSFEAVVPTADEMRTRMARASTTHPWIVADEGDHLSGYAYAIQFRSRDAYRFSVETTVYIDPAHHRQGLGRKLMTELLERLAAQGHHLALALVTLPNEGSVALHESLGFEKVGVIPEVGFKLDCWHGVGIWSLKLQRD